MPFHLSLSFLNAGKPIYGVKTNSGVTAACLPSYYEAYDAYTHRSVHTHRVRIDRAALGTEFTRLTGIHGVHKPIAKEEGYIQKKRQRLSLCCLGDRIY